MQGYANWGGLVKELGCQIVTQKLDSVAGYIPSAHRPLTALSFSLSFMIATFQTPLQITFTIKHFAT